MSLTFFPSNLPEFFPGHWVLMESMKEELSVGSRSDNQQGKRLVLVELPRRIFLDWPSLGIQSFRSISQMFFSFHQLPLLWKPAQKNDAKSAHGSFCLPERSFWTTGLPWEEVLSVRHFLSGSLDSLLVTKPSVSRPLPSSVASSLANPCHSWDTSSTQNHLCSYTPTCHCPPWMCLSNLTPSLFTFSSLPPSFFFFSPSIFKNSFPVPDAGMS